MRKQYNLAPSDLVDRINDHLAAGDSHSAVLVAFDAGYDLHPVPTPHLDRLADLRKGDDALRAVEYEQRHSLQIQSEQSALTMSNSPARRTWAEQTSIETDRKTAEAEAKREADERAKFVAGRRKQILSDAKRQAEAEAETQAEREYEATS